MSLIIESGGDGKLEKKINIERKVTDENNQLGKEINLKITEERGVAPENQGTSRVKIRENQINYETKKEEGNKTINVVKDKVASNTRDLLVNEEKQEKEEKNSFQKNTAYMNDKKHLHIEKGFKDENKPTHEKLKADAKHLGQDNMGSKQFDKIPHVLEGKEIPPKSFIHKEINIENETCTPEPMKIKSEQKTVVQNTTNNGGVKSNPVHKEGNTKEAIAQEQEKGKNDTINHRELSKKSESTLKQGEVLINVQSLNNRPSSAVYKEIERDKWYPAQEVSEKKNNQNEAQAKIHLTNKENTKNNLNKELKKEENSPSEEKAKKLKENKLIENEKSTQEQTKKLSNQLSNKVSDGSPVGTSEKRNSLVKKQNENQSGNPNISSLSSGKRDTTINHLGITGSKVAKDENKEARENQSAKNDVNNTSKPNSDKQQVKNENYKRPLSIYDRYCKPKNRADLDDKSQSKAGNDIKSQTKNDKNNGSLQGSNKEDKPLTIYDRYCRPKSKTETEGGSQSRNNRSLSRNDRENRSQTRNDKDNKPLTIYDRYCRPQSKTEANSTLPTKNYTENRSGTRKDQHKRQTKIENGSQNVYDRLYRLSSKGNKDIGLKNNNDKDKSLKTDEKTSPSKKKISLKDVPSPKQIKKASEINYSTKNGKEESKIISVNG